jgi:putative peptide-modifying radical SAM enzyme
MDFMIYLTERYNLACKYCESVEDRNKFTQDPSYSKETLRDFLNKSPDLVLHFYGGEPLLNIPLLNYLLDNVSYKYATLQTNGFNLDKLDITHLNKLKVVSISIDGRKEETDKWRGKGTYDLAISAVKELKKRGYVGEINARMTVSPGLDIEKEVLHLLNECEVKFDRIHWQINALFNIEDWKENKQKITEWFEKDYNPKLLNLINYWAENIKDENEVIQIVPFTGIMHSFLTNQPQTNVRCGAGHTFWTITTDGNLFPCPVMRNFPEFSLGDIGKINPTDLMPKCMLTDTCTKCEIFSLCGGRCLNANLRNEWDKEGFNLVCSSVYTLIFGLGNHVEMIKEKIKEGKISLEEFENFHEYEIIP